MSMDSNLQLAFQAVAAAIRARVLASAVGAANGVAPLDATGKVPLSYLPESSAGGLNYQGVWDALNDSPSIPAASTANKGWYYKVSVAGATIVDGISDWGVGDWIISNGTEWQKIDNSDLVSSVAGKTGAVVLDKNDVGLNNVNNTADAVKNVLSATKLTTPRNINGVAFDGTADIEIEDRMGTSITSAATVNIAPLGIGETIHVTGTTNISSFGTAPAGVRRTIIFDNSLTVIHNSAAIRCPAGANMAVNQGTAIEVVSEGGGIWTVVNFIHDSVSYVEVGFLDGVSSNIQTQLDGKVGTGPFNTHVANVGPTDTDYVMVFTIALNTSS